MPRHLRRRGAAQRAAGVQGAAQAQALVQIFFDLGVEALQHGQGQFGQVHLVGNGGLDGVGHGFVSVAEGQAFF